MMSRVLSRVAMATFVGLMFTGFTGCAAIKCLPYNYMCGPSHAQCQNGNCQAQPPIPEMATMPVLADAPQLEELTKMKVRVDSLEEINSVLQQHIETLGKNAETQSLDRKEILVVMENVLREFATAKSDMDLQRRELVNVESRITRQRDHSEQVLATVEQELNDLLSQYEK